MLDCVDSLCDRIRIPRRLRISIVLVVCGAWQMANAPALAEPQHAPVVEQASYDRPVRGERRDAVHFARRAPQVGDQLEQTVAVELRLDTMVRQGNEVLEQTKTAIRRHQRRKVTTTDVEAGRPMAVIVRYVEAKKQAASGQSTAELPAGFPDGPATPQPVEGKTYRCRREGDELRITDAQGDIPPLDEFEIVAQNMDSLGRANPLADFLAGRTVNVGQTIQLPNELAQKLLGLGDTLGEVTRFSLTLNKVAPFDAAPGTRHTVLPGAGLAVFRASIDAASNDSSQMRLQLDGTLVIQAETCRAVQASLTGPIGMSETRGSLTATYQMTGTGKMTVNIASIYGDIAR